MISVGKRLVSEFYSSDFFNKVQQSEKYLHPKMELFWNAKTGYSHMSREDISKATAEVAKSFETVRCDITHLLEEGNNVTIRFTFYVTTIENPTEEMPIAHFVAIWEIKDGLMYKGYLMSQPAEAYPEAMISYRGINL